MLLARDLSKIEERKAEQEVLQREADKTRVWVERQHQIDYGRNRALIREQILDQLERDHAEADLIKAEEARVIAVRK